MAQHLGRINNCAWLCPACAGASSIHVCSARYLQPPPFLPCVSARHLLYPSLAVHARCPTLGASFYCLHALMPFFPTLGCSMSWFPHLGQINATRCEAVSSLPLSSYKPCTPHVLLCSRHGACQSCLTDAWCVFLLPSRSYAIRVCPTLGCSLSWIRHLGRITPQSVRLCAACAGASSTHVCSAQYLQPPQYVPCVSARHLLGPSLAFPTSFCHLCLRKVSCALPQHAISPSLPLASSAVDNIPSCTHTEPAPQCRTWPSTLAG